MRAFGLCIAVLKVRRGGNGTIVGAILMGAEPVRIGPADDEKEAEREDDERAETDEGEKDDDEMEGEAPMPLTGDWSNDELALLLGGCITGACLFVVLQIVTAKPLMVVLRGACVDVDELDKRRRLSESSNPCELFKWFSGSRVAVVAVDVSAVGFVITELMIELTMWLTPRG